MNINDYYSFVEIHLEVNHPFSLLEIINENYCEMGEWMDRKIWFGNQCENQFGGFYDGLRLKNIDDFIRTVGETETVPLHVLKN